jgi:hypothetical protein
MRLFAYSPVRLFAYAPTSDIPSVPEYSTANISILGAQTLLLRARPLPSARLRRRPRYLKEIIGDWKTSPNFIARNSPLHLLSLRATMTF